MTRRKSAASRRAAAQAAEARYDAAGTGRRIAAWNPPSTGPRGAVEGLPRLRSRSRDSVRNDWAGSGASQKWSTNLIGVGIVPRWKDDRYGELWAKHVPEADADCVLDAYGMQTLGVRSWFDGGEVFLRHRPRDLSLPLEAPVQYQLIESEYCPLFDAENGGWPGLPKSHDIRQGIERNIYGRRIAFWFHREHPGDPNVNATPSMLVRVPASEVSHIFEPARPGQMRGVSALSSILVRLRSTADFEDAVLDRQKLANLFVGFITRQIPESADLEYDSDTGLPKWYDKDGKPLAALESGIMQEMLPGENVTFANPPEAGTTYSDYLRSTDLRTAAGIGLPYEVLSGDIKDISDRTLRVIINEFRRFARQRQWQIVIPMLCRPMVNWWADALALKGDIAPSELPAVKNPTWSPEGWEYIHPTQDAEGKKLLIEAGLTSRSAVIAERGDDPRTVAEEMKADKKLGLVPEPPVAPAAAKPQPGKKDPDA